MTAACWVGSKSQKVLLTAGISVFIFPYEKEETAEENTYSSHVGGGKHAGPGSEDANTVHKSWSEVKTRTPRGTRQPSTEKSVDVVLLWGSSAVTFMLLLPLHTSPTTVVLRSNEEVVLSSSSVEL